MDAIETTADHHQHATNPEAGPARAGSLLALWMAMVVGLHGTLWVTGFRGRDLALAVEQGAARAERRGIGEASDDALRKAVRLQQDTRPFWATLILLGDFVVGPLALAGRALVVATAFAALAALTGRPIGFAAALHACAAMQGIWVVGLAVRVALAVGLRRAEVDTSLALALPPGTYPALLWLALRQADVFAIYGWLALAVGGWRRGQVNLFNGLMICGTLALGEAACRLAADAVIGAGIRLTVFPE